MLKSRWARWLGVGLWLLIVSCYLGYLGSQGKSPGRAALDALHWLRTEPWAPAAFILAFVARPIILVPASLLAVIAGHCFGALWGELWATLAGLVAAAVVFGIGRLWRSGSEGDNEGGGRWQSFRKRLAENGLQTTIGMRVAMLPYDPISFVSGNVGLPFGVFLLGTLVGNIPGTTSCVLFGASIKGEFQGQMPSIDWRMQGGAIALFVVAFVLQAIVKKRNAQL